VISFAHESSALEAAVARRRLEGAIVFTSDGSDRLRLTAPSSTPLPECFRGTS
jgi:hypothetical protein